MSTLFVSRGTGFPSYYKQQRFGDFGEVCDVNYDTQNHILYWYDQHHAEWVVEGEEYNHTFQTKDAALRQMEELSRQYREEDPYEEEDFMSTAPYSFADSMTRARILAKEAAGYEPPALWKTALMGLLTLSSSGIFNVLSYNLAQPTPELQDEPAAPEAPSHSDVVRRGAGVQDTLTQWAQRSLPYIVTPLVTTVASRKAGGSPFSSLLLNIFGLGVTPFVSAENLPIGCTGSVYGDRQTNTHLFSGLVYTPKSASEAYFDGCPVQGTISSQLPLGQMGQKVTCLQNERLIRVDSLEWRQQIDNCWYVQERVVGYGNETLFGLFCPKATPLSTPKVVVISSPTGFIDSRDLSHYTRFRPYPTSFLIQGSEIIERDRQISDSKSDNFKFPPNL